MLIIDDAVNQYHNEFEHRLQSRKINRSQARVVIKPATDQHGILLLMTTLAYAQINRLH